MNSRVDKYLVDGCMRCEYGATPNCQVHRWTTELELLRSILQKSELTEELKWGVPCYTINKKNVVIIAAFKEFCTISFFKGSLLKDPKKVLVKNGPNTQAGRVIKFKTLSEIKKLRSIINTFVKEAIEIEKAGKEVKFKKQETKIPEELEHAFNENPRLKDAFYELTPGRQRGYLLHFSEAKRTATRALRIKKNTEQIMRGEGLHDKYKGC